MAAHLEAHHLPLLNLSPKSTTVDAEASGKAGRTFTAQWESAEQALLDTLHALLSTKQTAQHVGDAALLAVVDAAVRVHLSRLYRLSLHVVETATEGTTAGAMQRLSEDWFEGRPRDKSGSKEHSQSASYMSPRQEASHGAPMSMTSRNESLPVTAAARDANNQRMRTSIPATYTNTRVPPVESWMMPPQAATADQHHSPVGKPVFVPVGRGLAHVSPPHGSSTAPPPPRRMPALASPVPYVELLVSPQQQYRRPFTTGAAASRHAQASRRSYEGVTVFPASRSASPASTNRTSRQSAPPHFAPPLAAEWLTERRARVSERALRTAQAVERRQSDGGVWQVG